MKKSVAAIFVLGVQILVANDGWADHEGCLVTGTGPTVVAAECEYTAQSESQTVIAATPNFWRLTTVRYNCPVWENGCEPVLEDGCQPAPENTCEQKTNAQGEPIFTPRTIVLLEGAGIPAGPPPTVHPKLGEEVTVRIFHDWATDSGSLLTAALGQTGFIWVGATDGHP